MNNKISKCYELSAINTGEDISTDFMSSLRKGIDILRYNKPSINDVFNVIDDLLGLIEVLYETRKEKENER